MYVAGDDEDEDDEDEDDDVDPAFLDAQPRVVRLEGKGEALAGQSRRAGEGVGGVVRSNGDALASNSLR